MTKKLAGKKQKHWSDVESTHKEVDLGETNIFPGSWKLGCTQRQCEISKDIVDNYRTTFESRISAGATEKLPCPENIRISSWSYDMEGHAKKCVERYCELANRTTQQLYKVSTPCIDDHHFKEEELKSVGELSKICSEIVLKCLYLARIGRPDIPWSVNKLARSITKWTKACDKRLSRFISYIHHTCDYKQYCPCGKHGKTMHIGTVSRTPILQEILRIQSLHQVEHCAFSEAIRLFKSVWMCKKQTSVRTVQQNQKSCPLNSGWRMDGIPALDFWDLIVAVLHGNTYQNDQVRGDPNKSPTRKKMHGKID